ncbi:hypothetical protein NDU88_007276 [Pleurodeles waltl]|uniref:Uncharacterized protein n=1 Tax=Pleurodeles waltl TaxID=8319 RepID=A0AAV7LZE9_PLEWA|nr:hypothetical protein NDU88_007276 [Pleurodeles waltl]
MWASIVFTDPGVKLRDVSGEELFSEHPLTGTVVFEMDISIRMQLQLRTVSKLTQDTTIRERDLAKVPEVLWTKEPHDMGLSKGAEPVKMTLKCGAILPRIRQYPLSKEAEEDILPTIQALLEQ